MTLLRFHTPEGKRLFEDDTPESIGLQDGAIIEAGIEKLGGASDGALPLPSVEAPTPPMVAPKLLTIKVRCVEGCVCHDFQLV